MEKNQYGIISDIRSLLDSLKEQVGVIESKLAELEASAPQEAQDMPIDISIDMEDFPGIGDMPASTEPVPAVTEVPDVPAEAEDYPSANQDLPDTAEDAVESLDSPAPEEEQAVMEHHAAEPVTESAQRPLEKDQTEPESVLLPQESLEESLPAAPARSINDVERTKARKTVIDAAREQQAWRKDMPGTAVKNIISAISLADRALLINTLFSGDAIAFNDAITAFNGMSSFEQAEQYITENHPGWNMNSEIVYRLMMAIRRKLR